MTAVITVRQLVSLCGVREMLRVMAARLRGLPAVLIRLAGLPQPVTVRFNNSDLVLFLGVFLHRDCHVILQPPPATVIDLGANTGFTASAFMQQFPKAKILAVEPDAKTFELCRTNTRRYSSITCLQRAVGAEPGWAHADNPEDIAMARRYSFGNASTHPSDIRACTVEELLEEFSCPEPILVKMDIEGSEIPIFRNPGAWLSKVQAVLVEPHGEGTDELIRRVLTERGFRVGQIGEKIFGTRAPW